MNDLAQEWAQSTALLGGDPSVAQAPGRWLAEQYQSPARRYHDSAHIEAVLRGIDDLAGELALSAQEHAVARAAGCAHDVVYTGSAGEDERASARWAHDALVAAGADEQAADQVAALILATIDHHGSTAVERALLDADLSILAAEPDAYARYRQQVREEYGQLDERQWRTGRSAVLRSFLDRREVFLSEPARDRWEAAARRNMAAELADLQAPAS